MCPTSGDTTWLACNDMVLTGSRIGIVLQCRSGGISSTPHNCSIPNILHSLEKYITAYNLGILLWHGSLTGSHLSCLHPLGNICLCGGTQNSGRSQKASMWRNRGIHKILHLVHAQEKGTSHFKNYKPNISFPPPLSISAMLPNHRFP